MNRNTGLGSRKIVILTLGVVVGAAVGYVLPVPFLGTGSETLGALSSRNLPVAHSPADSDPSGLDQLSASFFRSMAQASTEDETIQALNLLQENFIGGWYAVLSLEEFDEQLIGPDSVLGRALLNAAWRAPEKAQKWLWERNPQWRRAWLELNITRCPGPIAMAALDSIFSSSGSDSENEDFLTEQLIRVASNTEGRRLFEMLAEIAPDRLSDFNLNQLDFENLDPKSTIESLPHDQRTRFGIHYALDVALNQGNIEESLQWLQDHLSSEEHEQARSQLLGALIQRAPSEVADGVRKGQITLSVSQQADLLETYSHLDYEATRTWAASLPDSRDRDRAMALVGAQPWASAAEKESAMAYLRENPDDPSMQKFVGHLVDRSSGISDTIALMDSFPIGSSAARTVVMETVQQLANQNPMGVSEFLGSVPLENSSDQAIEMLIAAIPDDVVGSFSWSLRIEDRTKRAGLISQFGNALHSADQQEFARIISSLEIEERQEVMAILGGSTE